MNDITDTSRRGFPWRIIGWGGILVLLAIPAIAMQFDNGFDWTLGDFVIAGIALGLVGLLAELTVRASGNWIYRIGVGLLVAGCFFTLWFTGAVGIIGNEDNPLNQMYLLMVGLIAIGAVVSRGKPMPLAHVAGFAAGTEIVIAAIAMANGYNIWPISIGFAAMFLASSLQFRKAA